MLSGLASALQERLKPLRRHWTLLLAIAFALYSTLLLTYATSTSQHMRQEATDYLVADNMRRATALGDLIDQLTDTAIMHADLHEVRSYLLNRDLGMSPRYGLNSSLAAMQERFINLAERLAQRWNIPAPRIVYYSEQNETLADSRIRPSELPPPLRAGLQTRMRIDAWTGQIEIVAPVIHKGNRDGVVVTLFPVEVLYRNLLPPDSTSGYRELLLLQDGKRLPGRELDIAFDNAQFRRLTTLADNQPLPTTALGTLAADSPLQDSLLVKTPVRDSAMLLVTFLNERQVYGHLLSHHVLLGAGVLLLLMLYGAYKLDRMRLQAEHLEADRATADQQRALTEFRNVELSAEVQRRTQAESALAESQERWELAIAGTNDGIWDWNIRTSEVFFSQRWKSMLGYQDEDIGSHLEAWSALLHPDDQGRVYAEIEKHLRGNSPFFQSEQRLRCRDGSYKWILARGRALFDASGQAVRMAGSHTDISEERVAQERIADRNAQLDAIFSLSPDAFVSFDAARRVKYANPAFLDMTGYKEADIVGLDEETFSARLANDCLPTARFEGVTTLRQVQEAGEIAPPRLLIELAGPDKRVIELKLRLANAATVAQILYLRDVTHEVEVDRMKSEFLSHAAHELRTPMASIYGFTELLVAQDLLQTIHKQTAWLIEIINELLDIARIESRRGKDFKIEPVTLAPLVIDVLSSMQFDAKRWPVTLNLPANLPAVRADAAKLRQALTNILGNAVKYSPQGGGIVIAGAPRLVGDKSMVSLVITDHGIGMTGEQVARACERFYRADTSGNIPGTGLGMAIVKEVVELLGGSIGIASAPRLGTTVTILLPATVIAKLPPSANPAG
jgi:PAS domain S-box-containing protein